MTVVGLVFQSVTLDWVMSLDENADVHSEAFVLYDGTTKYAPVANAGKTLTFTGIEKGVTDLETMRTKIGLVGPLTYPNQSNTSMTITDFSYNFRAFDGTNYYYDWSLTFGQSQ